MTKLQKQNTKNKEDEINNIISHEKYKQDYDCYSKIDLMKYLAAEYRKGSEADGR